MSAAPASVRTALAWGAGAAAVLLTAAVTTAARARWTSRWLRDQNAVLAARADQFAADAVRATEDAQRARSDAERAAAEHARSESVRAAALAAGANAASRVQAMMTGMLADLRAMENRHADEDVLSDLLHLDHRTAQAGRLADSIAVLAGGRSGRRWAKPIVIESILRGAMGRISGYQRIRLHSTSDAAVAGHAAEGVMHALAELLDNAANFSPPTSEVHVYVEDVAAGILITVEDSGLVMSDIQQRRAERAVTSSESGFSSLSGTRLGLAVVGRLAGKHGLKVSFRPSARGGTGALMLLPHDVITRAPSGTPAPATAPGPVPAARPAAVQAAAAPVSPASAPSITAAEAAQPPEIGPSGLPKRRRGVTLAAALLRSGESARNAEPAAEPPAPTDSTTQALRFSSFRKAVSATLSDPAGPTRPESSHPEGKTP